MKNNEHKESFSLRSIFQLGLRHFTLAILATIFLSGCGSGGGGDGSGTSGGGSSGTTTAMAVIASATVGPNGGTVADSSGETAVIVPPGAVSTDTTIQILRGRDANGNVVTSFTATPPAGGQVQLVLPDTDVLESNTPQNPSATTQNVQGVSSDNLVAAAVSTPGVASDYPDKIWREQNRKFWASHNDIGSFQGNRIDDRNVTTTLDEGGFPIRSLPAFRLSSIWYESERSGYEGKEAVLFVNGHIPAIFGLGGGEDTWGQFPKALNDAGYVPFEFRWRTAARFEDVAQDLCQAVDLIAESTGKQIHIVAHSFGGILTRVYLQGLASGKCKYKGNVASVTTIGTPHAGIFDAPITRDGILFSGGQDSTLFEMCLQLACYQMGENVDFVKLNSLLISEKNAKAVFRVEATRGEIAAKIADTSTNPLPSVPIQVLIGLTTSRDDKTILDAGDGLISYQGQRFSPQYASLLGKTPISSAKVTERVLGFGPDDDMRPGDYNSLTPGAENYAGYRHSGLPVGPDDAIRMANIGCDLRNDLGLVDIPNCASGGFGHPSLSYAYSWITNNAAGLATNGPKFTLRVSIQDATTNASIVGASVKVKSSGYDLGGPTLTDQDGYANIGTRFLAGVAYDIVVTKVGYHAKEFPSILTTGDSQGDIELPPKALTPETGTTATSPAQFFTLTVAVNVAGSGSVTGNGIVCPSDCMTTDKSGTTIVLTPKSDAGSSFSGWAGCSSIQGDYCYVTLGADRAVTASFAKTTSTSSSITVGPTLLNFGNVSVGTCKTYPFVIQHVAGTDPASGTVSVSPNTVFNVASGNSFSVSNGTAAFVDVRFCPTSSQTYTATATVTSSATFTGANTVTLNGSGSVSTTIPLAPSTLTASTLSQNNIALTWQDNSDNETGFKIERKTGTSGTFAQIATVGPISGVGSGGYYENTGLTAATTYCYRTRAYNTAGDSSYTSESCATTQQAPVITPPNATTSPATNVTSNSATLNGTVNPNGTASGAFFQWGTTTSYGNLTPNDTTPGSGTTAQPVFANLTGLSPNTTYHFRIVASSGPNTTVFGADQSFTTASTPSTTPTVISVSPNTLTQGTGAQYVTITGAYFTSSSYHQFSNNAPGSWYDPQIAPTINNSIS